MKNFFISTVCIAAFMFIIVSCSKNNNNVTPVSSDGSLEGQVLTQFATNLVNPNYVDIQAKANLMLTASNTLIATTTDANLTAMRTTWVNTRGAWESCEGFLFGP